MQGGCYPSTGGGCSDSFLNMHYGLITGCVVATQKVDQLKGIALKVMIPCNEQKEPIGDPVVAIDAVGARPGDMVLWVGKREASMAVPGAQVVNFYPVDVAITGIIDDIG